MAHAADHPEPTGYVGRPVKRINDRALITGRGRFVDDLHLPGTLYVAFVRSPYAHARVVKIDTDAARNAPGVVQVVTGAELTAWMPPHAIVDPALLPNRPMLRHSLTPDVARFAGDAVAAIIAESAAQAEDALDLVDVDWETLTPVTTAEAALAPEAPVIHPGWDSNLAYHMSSTAGEVDAAFTDAAHTLSVRLVQPRVASMYVEPKAVVARWDEADERLTVWASTQTPHGVRTQIAGVTGLPEHAVRVIAPDVGGAFGTKGRHAADYLFVAAAAHHLRRTVSWVETRSEYFRSSNQGRDQVQEVDVAVSEEGIITAMRVRVWLNLGAYNLSAHGARTFQMASGMFTVRNLTVDVYGVVTTTTPTGPYRGAGRPEAAYMVERVVTAVAQTTGIDANTIRRRNFIPADAFPYRSATGIVYDSGDYGPALDMALAAADAEGYTSLLADLRASGKIAGMGVAAFVEPSGGGWDSAEVRVSPTGAVTVFVGVSPHGQGTETTFAQIVADELGVPMESIAIRASDTDTTAQGIGTFGSRNMAVGGSAVITAARKVGSKMRHLAGAMLETTAEDIELRDNAAFVVGAPDRSVSVPRIAAAAHVPDRTPGGLEPGLNETSFFRPDGSQFPFGVHVAVVSIDPDTGVITLERYLGVDDCGTVINPLIVAGQVHGGLAQGIGQALMEEVVFDADGQPLTASLMDYAVPRAVDFPMITLEHTTTPSPWTAHGAKGVGEAGTTGAPPTIVNAVLDALAPYGVTHLDMPITSARVWAALQEQRLAAAAD